MNGGKKETDRQTDTRLMHYKFAFWFGRKEFSWGISSFTFEFCVTFVPQIADCGRGAGAIALFFLRRPIVFVDL